MCVCVCVCVCVCKSKSKSQDYKFFQPDSTFLSAFPLLRPLFACVTQDRIGHFGWLLRLRRTVHNTSRQSPSHCLFLQAACTFDSSLKEAFTTRVIKYQPLLNTISELGYRVRATCFFISDSTGRTDRSVKRRFRQLLMSIKEGKQYSLARHS